MKNVKTTAVAFVTAALTLSGCSTEMLNEGDQADAFLKGFIKTMKVVPAEDHSYSMASRGEVTVRSSVPRDVQVVAKVGGKRYCFYEANGVTDGTKLIFDIPCDVKSVYVIANGQNYPVGLNGTVNLDKDPVRTGLSRANSTFYESFAGKVWEVVDMRSSAEKSASDLAKGMLGVHADLLGGRLETNFETLTTVTGAKILQQELSTSALHEVDYYTSSKFTDVTLVPNWANPNIYIYYVRKPGGVNYTIGMMIGDGATLAESSSVYKIPMFDTSEMGEETFRMRVAKTEGHTLQIAETIFDFANNRVTVNEDGHYDHLPRWIQDITFTDDFKDQVRNMATLCQTGFNGTQLKTSAHCYDNGDNPTWGGDEYKVKPALEYESLNDFYDAYSNYLKGYFEYVLNTSDERMAARLHDVKEYLTRAGVQFIDNEYPIVTPAETPDTYIVKFYKALGDRDGTQIVAADGADANRYSLFEPANNRFLLYYGINTYTALPDALNGNHEFVYYVEFKNNTEVKGKTIVTTGDEGVLKKIVPTLTETHSPYDVDGTRYCMDLDDDGIYDDLIFGAAGAAPGTPWHVDKYQWLLACEDLGSFDDIDYNDIVVGVRVTQYGVEDTDLEFRAMAAGGVLPAYLMYSQKVLDKDEFETYFVGPEIHAWLGQPIDIYNTESATKTGPDGINPVTFKFYNSKNGDKPFSLSDMMESRDFSSLGYRFWVLVDKDNWLKTNGLAPDDNSRELKPLMYEGQSITNFHQWANQSLAGQHFNLINAPGDKSYKGEHAPLIICVGNDWEWPKERVNIQDAYPDFTDWIENPDLYKAKESDPSFVPKKWYGLDEDGHLIDGVDRGSVSKRITPKND